MIKMIYRMLVLLALVVPGVAQASLEDDDSSHDPMLFAHIYSGLEECYNIKKTNGVNADYAAQIKRIKEDIDELADCNEPLLNVKTDDETQSTLLIMAARYNCFEIARYLLDKFEITKFDHPNEYNLTAYDYVRTADMPVLDKDCGGFWKVQNGVAVPINGKPLIHQNREFAEYLKTKMEAQRKSVVRKDLQAKDKQDLADKALADAKKDHKEGAEVPFAAAVEKPVQPLTTLSAEECDDFAKQFKQYAKKILEERLGKFCCGIAPQQAETRKTFEQHLDNEFVRVIKAAIEKLSGRTDVPAFDVLALRERLLREYQTLKHEVQNTIAAQQKNMVEKQNKRVEEFRKTFSDLISKLKIAKEQRYGEGEIDEEIVKSVDVWARKIIPTEEISIQSRLQSAYRDLIKKEYDELAVKKAQAEARRERECAAEYAAHLQEQIEVDRVKLDMQAKSTMDFHIEHWRSLADNPHNPKAKLHKYILDETIISIYKGDYLLWWNDHQPYAHKCGICKSVQK